MSQVLAPLVGKRVHVRSLTGNGVCKDDGVLVAYDDTWIVLEKNENGKEHLYFPIVNIRLLVPL